MNKDLEKFLKRTYQFDRPGWDTFKLAVNSEWETYCNDSCCPSSSEAMTNFLKGRGAVWKQFRAMIETIETETS